MYILSMAVFGSLGPFVRNIAVSSGELALYRAMMGAALIGGYLLVKKQNPFSAGMRREVFLLLLSGAAMGVNWILLFEAYRYTTVSTATLCYYFAPVIVTALSPVLFRERLTPRQILCFLMATLGLALITGFESPGTGGASLAGILLGLGAAVFYAAVILLNKYIQNTAGIQRTFLQFLAAIVTLIPYVAVSGGVTLSRLDGTGWLCLLTVGIVHTGITYCLYFFLAESNARPEGRHSERPRATCGSAGIRHPSEGASDMAAGLGRRADPGIYPVEYPAGKEEGFVPVNGQKEAPSPLFRHAQYRFCRKWSFRTITDAPA